MKGIVAAKADVKHILDELETNCKKVKDKKVRKILKSLHAGNICMQKQMTKVLKKINGYELEIYYKEEMVLGKRVIVFETHRRR